MTSEVTICNLALGWLGQNAISSLDDRSRTAELCKANYYELRDAVLESRCWTFAEFRYESTTQDQAGDEGVNKTADNGYPEWGDDWVHSLPEYALKVFRVYRTVRGTELTDQAEWSKHNQYILADKPTVYMWGVRREENPNEFSKGFVQTLAARIAADLAIPITQNQKLQVQYWALYEEKLSDAAVRDGQQGRSESTRSTRLLRARSR